MFARGLVAYDGSAGAEAALGVGIDLAKGARTGLVSISIEERLPRYAASIGEVEDAREQIDAHFRDLAKQARDRAALEDIELETLVERGHVVERILALARDGRFDLLVLGSHGHSRIFQRLIGGTAMGLARLAPCSIFIARSEGPAAGGLARIDRILVGVDGSPLGRLAFRAALDFATLCDASLVGVSVWETSPLAGSDDGRSTYARQLGPAAEEHARAAGVAFEHVTLRGHVARALRGYAREIDAGLIVLGATGLEHPWSPTLGGTATAVAGEAPCSVLLVRSPHASSHVRDVMGRALSSVALDTPLAVVVELLLRRDVKAVPVLDERRRVAGIITGGDLLERGDLELRLSIERELGPDALGERLRALRQSRKSARDVMTPHVHTVEAETDLLTAVRLMARHRVKRLPVVDRGQTLVGIISRADVLRALAAVPDAGAPEPHGVSPAGRTVGDAAVRDVPLVHADTPVEDVLVGILASPLRRVVVSNDAGEVIGLVSDRDVLTRAGVDARPWFIRVLKAESAVRHRPSSTSDRPLTAADVMAGPLITVRPEDSLVHAIRLMMQHRLKRLVVIDAQRRFRGLVDRREIVRVLAEP